MRSRSLARGLYCLALGIWLWSNGYPQTSLPAGVKSIGLCQSDVAQPHPLESIFINPAGLGLNQNLTLSFQTTKLFGLSECPLHIVAFLASVNNHGIAVGLSDFGNKTFSDQSISVGWGSKIFSNFSVGLNASYVSQNFRGYPSIYFLLLDFGILVRFSKMINFGFCIQDVSSVRFSENETQSPTKVDLGISYQPDTSIFFSLSLFKELYFPIDIRGGIQLQPLDALQLRGGFGKETSTASLGATFFRSFWMIDYAVSFHSTLGATHYFSMSFEIR